MMSQAALCALLAAVGCTQNAAPPPAPAEAPNPAAAVAAAPAPAPAVPAAAAKEPGAPDEKTQKLVTMHDGLWDMMKLSPAAKKELNGIVVAVSVQMGKNRASHPEMFDKPAKRMDTPPTHDEYIAGHKRRFDKLGISEPTQKELLAGAEFVWTALQPDAKVSEEDKATALKIKQMMTELKGPPPCCDDDIFDKAAAPTN